MRLTYLTFLIMVLFIREAASQVKDYQFTRLNIQSGLSNNQINSIFKDSQGFMWFGTLSGLNRYDCYQFKIFRHDDLDTTTITDDFIQRMFEGPDNKLWIKTQSVFNIYDPATEKINRSAERYLTSIGLPGDGLLTILKAGTTYYFIYTDAGIYRYEAASGKTSMVLSGKELKNSPVTSAVLDSKNYIWLLRYNGIIEKFDGEQDKNLLRTALFQKQQPEVQFGFNMFIDRDDEIWLYQRNTLSGIYRYIPAGNSIIHYTTHTASTPLSSNAVNGIDQDQKGLIWIITDHGGVNIFDKTKEFITTLNHGENNNKSISDDVINAIYKDSDGIMWLGTNKQGISYYDENSNVFPLYYRTGNDGKSLPYDDVNAFAEDKKGNLWIATNGGGLIYFDRSKNTYTQFRHNPANPNSLSNDVVVSLCLDHQGKLWIGTYLGGMDCYDGKTFTHYRHNPSDPNSLADDRVFSIFEDSNLNLWVGTNNFGLDRFDRETNIFYHHNTTVPQTLHSQNVSSLMEDSRGNIWIGTSWGIDVLDKSSGRFIHYIHENSKLSYYNVNDIREDHYGNIWIATNRGLNVLQKGKSDFISFFVKDGLPDNTILTILEDEHYNLWVSTKAGISKIHIVREEGQDLRIRCTNYNEYDGLQGREFNRFAAYKTRAGELIFGGTNGFNLFRPESIINNSKPAPVVLTRFSLFNKNIAVGEKINNHVILPESISESREIVLKYNENDFSLDFSALDFTNTTKTQYRYLLVGYNKEWITTGSNTRTATYTNLDHGQYIFRVQASGNDGNWNSNEVQLRITVLPPFWKTPLAYFIYAALIFGVLYFSRKMIIAREKDRHLLAEERREAQRRRELDLMKIKFFTNVSHEFRTPISLILSPIARFIRDARTLEEKNQFVLIQRNARRLLNMVNQLLDFRKMEVNELKLNQSEGDIIEFLRELSWSFTDLADKKNIRFSFHSTTDHLVMFFDQDKIERILFNLLSNAFKFTPENGTVSVELDLVQQTGQPCLLISVQDNGIGIEEDKLPKIFDRFFQVNIPNHILNQGSGIGLSITREFVDMHRGRITVASKPGEGSRFTVSLPVISGIKEKNSELPDHEPSVQDETLAGKPLNPGNALINQKKPTLLIVEDNEDFLFYLKDNLKELFNVEVAGNGREGWKKTLSIHPDLIVSDISMPVMSGDELCRKIKTDSRTSHIPVILLTAHAGEQQQLIALETGPNDYITKPFNFEILISRIKNLLAYQNLVREKYLKQVDVSPSEINEESPEDVFLKSVLEIIEENMSNEDFSVEYLRSKLLISRTGMYKRILAITGKTPIELIRCMRLKRARQLLEKTNHNVTEIAYMVGFNNPKYFTRYFKEEFGILPSAYQAEMKKNAPQYKSDISE